MKALNKAEVRAKAEIRDQALEEAEMLSHISGGKNGSEKE